MKKIHVIAKFKIHQGKLAEFKQGADQCVLVTKKEAGALMYDWFIDAESNACTVIETYQDSEATLAHVQNVHEPLSQLMAISDFAGEVYGNASAELKGALAQMSVVPVPFFGGL